MSKQVIERIWLAGMVAGAMVLAALAVPPLAHAQGIAVSAPASAQRAGSISGVVKDSSGAEIPGATVRVVNEQTSAASEAVTDGQGAFNVADLLPGRYRVEASLDGFETNVTTVV